MAGTSLIEVMVSLVILAIGILGFLAMQIQSLETVSDAHFRGQATGIAQDVIERIKANPLGWPDEYSSQKWSGVDSVSQPPCFKKMVPRDASRSCQNPAEMAAYDHFEISGLLSVSLPNGALTIQQPCEGSVAVACVQVSWGDSGEGSLAGSNGNCLVGRLTMDQIKDYRCVVIEFLAFQKI